MDFLEILKNFINSISVFLLNFFDWYIVTFLYALIYVLYLGQVNRFVAKEFKKRKEIIQDIHIYKVTHPKELYPSDSEEQMKSIFQRNQPQYPESYYKALEQIVSKWNGKPLLAFLLVVSQAWLFIALLSYHMLLEGYIEENVLLYCGNIILLAILMLGRKLFWLKFIFYLIAVIAYHFFSPEALLFIGLVACLRIIHKIWVRILKNIPKSLNK